MSPPIGASDLGIQIRRRVHWNDDDQYATAVVGIHLVVLDFTRRSVRLSNSIEHYECHRSQQ
jgi:hypothetical protein